MPLGGHKWSCSFCAAVFRTPFELRGHVTGKHNRTAPDSEPIDLVAEEQLVSDASAVQDAINDIEILKIQRRGRLRDGPGGHMGDADIMRAEKYATDVCSTVHSQVNSALDAMGTELFSPADLKGILDPIFRVLLPQTRNQ